MLRRTGLRAVLLRCQQRRKWCLIGSVIYYPEIAALHDECVRLHKAKRDELMAQDSYREMYDQLASLPPYPPGELELMQELGIAP